MEDTRRHPCAAEKFLAFPREGTYGDRPGAPPDVATARTLATFLVQRFNPDS